MTAPLPDPTRTLLAAGCDPQFLCSILTLTSAPASDTRNAEENRAPTDSGIRLGHVHLKVRSLDESMLYYRWLLGWRLSERTGRFAFLAAADEHHSLALEEVGEWAVNPERRAVGMSHLAFEAADEETFMSTLRKLTEAGVPVTSRNNGISWALKLRDPDGHYVEIYLDRRNTQEGTPLWKGQWHPPFEGRPLPAASQQ